MKGSFDPETLTNTAREEQNAITRRVEIARSPEAVYAFWRDPENARTVTPGGVEVQNVTAERARWRVRLLGDREWTLEMRCVRDDPGRLIVWQSEPGADVSVMSKVQLTPLDHGAATELTMTTMWGRPHGALGAMLAAAGGRVAGDATEVLLTRVKRQLEAEGRSA